MAGTIAQEQELIRRCQRFRNEGRPESVLRSEFQSRLRQIFPEAENDTWVNHYSTGTEAHTKIVAAEGKSADRFIDNLIGATSIEYEADLRVRSKFDIGFKQVKEHAAGLLRSGIPVSQVRCILSDTVDWYTYDVALPAGIEPHSCTVGDIGLSLVDKLQIATADDTSAELLIAFLRKHLAREQSRPLRADLLTDDLGLESIRFTRVIGSLVALVEAGRVEDPSVVLATDLWSQFVDYLEVEEGAFRPLAFSNEVYLSILARLLAANVLSQGAILSDDIELKTILDGSYFRTHYHLENMVEFDYFGWLFSETRIDALVPIAHEIQRDLFVYDFSWYPDEDLFGRLMAQLARRSQRKLLGQEWTPTWLAKLVAEKCLENLPSGEAPQIVDMCCGSGSILIEILKEARRRFSLTEIDALYSVATGFDIDPLAVSLAKTNWVVTLAAEIKMATGPVNVPVYHADSLFAITPVSVSLPFLGEEHTVKISLDGATIELPNAALQPEYRKLFDLIVDWAYDEALDAQAEGRVLDPHHLNVSDFLKGAEDLTGCTIPKKILGELIPGVEALVCRMAELAVANRNGIWAFILRNTYRPGFLTGQFNGLACNPPWLTMSGLANNPYRDILTERASRYGIRPSGQSFLHLELGTTHLLHAIDRYLKKGSSIVCLAPGTIFNGHHHEPLRSRSFLTSNRPVPFELDQVWQVRSGTFKYPGAALIGRKRADAASCRNQDVKGFIAAPDGLIAVDFSFRQLRSGRSAWVLEEEGEPVAAGGMTEIPQQGADLMPRTAVCVIDLGGAGDESERRVETPGPGTAWAFTVSEAKNLKGEKFPGHLAPQFLFRMAQSKNLLPYVFGDHCAPVALPAARDASGAWRIFDDDEIRRGGYLQTARRFKTINARLSVASNHKTLQERIDERGKLTKQTFGADGYLLLSGAGGKHICAACIPVSDAADLVIDQTLYWQHFASKDAAWFYVGMLNSHAMTEAIAPFNPRGEFGPRHVHTLPYRLMPAFDATNEDHETISRLAQRVAGIAETMVRTNDYLNDPSRRLNIRRSRLRDALQAAPDVQKLEYLCAWQLGVSSKYAERGE